MLFWGRRNKISWRATNPEDAFIFTGAQRRHRDFHFADEATEAEFGMLQGYLNNKRQNWIARLDLPC